MKFASLAGIAVLSLIALAPLTASAQFYTYSTATGGAIPDGNTTGISSTITVADDFTLDTFTSVTITGLQHTYLGELIITLSHGGKTVDIIDRVRGGGTATFGDTSNLNGDYTFVTTGGADFNAAAATASNANNVPTNANYATVPVGNTAPSGGVSSANGLLSNFSGMAVGGAWTLNIQDRLAADTGSFTGWQFTVADPSYINTNRTISDASLNGFPTVRVGNSTSTDVTLAAGGQVKNVQTFNGSRLFMNGGAATSLRAEDTSRLFVNAGTVSGDIAVTENGRLTMGGGSANSVTVSGSGVANITDGTVGTVTANAGATAYVFDGTFTDLAANGGNIFVYGGTISQNTLLAYGNGAIYLYGTNLVFDHASKTAGFDFAGNPGFFYNVTGTLTDGTALNTRFFDANGGKSVVGENPGALYLNNVAVVPEMGAGWLALAGTGGLGVVVRRRGVRGNALDR